MSYNNVNDNPYYQAAEEGLSKAMQRISEMESDFHPYMMKEYEEVKNSLLQNAVDLVKFGVDKEIVDEMFVTGDKVLFDATASRTSIEMRGELQADSVIIDGNKSYTFSGSAGSIVNNTVLVKRGTGMLTINNDNSFIGGTRISGGIVSVKSLANENMEKGNLGGVTNVARLFVIENGSELRTTAPVTQGSPMSMQSEEGGIINNSNDFFNI